MQGWAGWPSLLIACSITSPPLPVGQVSISALLIWSARQLAHDLLAVGIHRVQALLHYPQQVLRIGRVMTVCIQCAHYVRLLSDPRLALRDVAIGSRQILAQL
jgi:hypothetical protein